MFSAGELQMEVKGLGVGKGFAVVEEECEVGSG